MDLDCLCVCGSVRWAVCLHVCKPVLVFACELVPVSALTQGVHESTKVCFLDMSLSTLNEFLSGIVELVSLCLHMCVAGCLCPLVFDYVRDSAWFLTFPCPSPLMHSSC